MRKNYSNGFTICFAGIFLLNVFKTVAGGDPLLALHCLDNGQCENFKNETMNATCGANAQCQCTLLATHEPTDCIANEVKVTNIISGPCPCTQSHSVCHEEQQICFCADKYVPSLDLRRCLHRERNLDETCELDSQCRGGNEFAVCDSRLCKCQENHAIINGTCVPLAENIKCQTNEGCKVKDSHLICSPEKFCVCHTGYVFALAKNSTNASCLPTLQYHDTCLSDVQCQHTLGWGAECNNQDICECKTEHFIKTFNPEVPLNLTKQLCQPKINFGKYCNDEKDCYQPYLADQAQTMHCSYASCKCRYGFLNEKLFICNPPISDASGLWRIYSQLYSIIFLFFILLL